MGKRFNTVNLRFQREELTHVDYTMEIKHDDVALVGKMNDEELYNWVHEIAHDNKYNDDRPEFYEMTAGKESVEGEGDMGMFDFNIETYSPSGSRLAIDKIGKPVPAERPVEMISVPRPAIDYNDYPNAARAAWAGAAIDVFMAVASTDREDALADLLCDLMHWSDHQDNDEATDFVNAYMRALGHYKEELRSVDNKQKEALHKLYQPLIGGKIVGFRIDEDDFGMAPFPVLIVNVHGTDYECAISADEEGNGGGFMFIEDYNSDLGGKTQKGVKQ